MSFFIHVLISEYIMHKIPYLYIVNFAGCIIDYY